MGIVELIPNKLDRIYLFSMKPTLFIDYIDSFDSPPDQMEGALMVPMFKWELYQNPEKLNQFFKCYNDFVERALKVKVEDVIFLTTSQHLAGFSVLADYDHTGETTIKSVKEDPTKHLLKCYNNPLNYGIMMNLFSNFLGIKGRTLTNILLNKKLSN